MTASRSVAMREFAWALRWMGRGWGLVLLLTYAIVVGAEIILMIFTGRLRGLDRQLMLNIVFTLQLCSLMMAAGTWMYFLARRSFSPFRPGRLGDLLAAPLSPRELWPGMLMGPTAIATAFAVIAQTLNLLLPELAGEPHYLVYSYLRSPDSMGPESLYWVRVVTFARAPIMVLAATVLALTYGALAAALVLPGGGSGRLVIVVLAAQVLLVPEILTAIWVDNSAVLSGSVAERFQLVSDHISGPLLTLALSGIVYGISIRVLRGRRFQARLARAIEHL